MDIVKMSPLVALLAEEEKKGTKKKKLTPLPSTARLCALGFFLSFSLMLHAWKRRESKNTITESFVRWCIPRTSTLSIFLCYVLKHTSIHISFSYFFMLVAYTARPKTKGKRDLSIVFLHIYATKVITRFIFFLMRSDKPDRKSLRQATHGVRKQKKKKKRNWFYVKQVNIPLNYTYKFKENTHKREKKRKERKPRGIYN